MSDTVKVKILRTTQHGSLYLEKGKTADIPASLAAELAKLSKPAVEIIKGKN